MHQVSALLIAGILFFTVALSSCTSGPGTDQDASGDAFSAKLAKHADDADLERRLKDQLKRWYEQQYDRMVYGCRSGGPSGPVQPDMGNAGGQPVAGAAGPTPHSGTNNQEAGVDEGDLVKTDGTYLYLARGTHFYVVSALPPEQSSLVSDIDLHEFITELHLHGNRVAVITELWGDAGVGFAGTSTPWMAGKAFTKVYFYDITNPSAPEPVSSLEFAGAMLGSRRINDSLYIALNSTIRLINPATPWNYLETWPSDYDVFAAAAKKALDENLNRIEALTIADLLPLYTVTPYADGIAGSPAVLPALASGDLYIPQYGNGVDLSLVAQVDLSGRTPSVDATTAVLSSWCRVYMTQDNLYLASDNNWMWIEPVQDGEAPPRNSPPRTAFHKFALVENDKPLYRGSGIVEGWLNDRFSMGDYKGRLRVGTTRGGWWGESITNQLTILKENDEGELVETANIAGIAPGERIYSMRFDGDKGYMVTFRQTDPLYTFDLSDPDNPKISGELKVNGFATYIHLIGGDSDLLLTIGPSADDQGRVYGNKLQLISVADPANPVVVSAFELGSGWSSALYDPHAFLYYNGLLTIPYFGYEGGSYTSGLKVFSIGASTIAEKGVIQAKTFTSGYGSYQDTVDRSVIVGDSLYAVSHRSITAADIATLNILSSVDLPESYLMTPDGMTGGVAVP